MVDDISRHATCVPIAGLHRNSLQFDLFLGPPCGSHRSFSILPDSVSSEIQATRCAVGGVRPSSWASAIVHAAQQEPAPNLKADVHR